jgi:peptidoglycan/LPS O-acetylase OafA/YrhL
MARRFARLYPLHLLTLFAALAYELIKWKVFGTTEIDANKAPFESNTVTAFIANLFLVHALGLFPDVTWNGPSWSISVEFYAYLSFAILVLLTRTRRTAFWLLLVFAPILSLLVLVTRTRGDFLSVETDYGFFRCVLGFGLGVIVQRLLARTQRARAEVERSGSQDWLKALLAVCIMILIGSPTYKTPVTLLAPFIFAGFIWLLVRHRGGWIERLLLSRACQFLGTLSFSVYMTHSLFRVVLKTVWRLGQRCEVLHGGWGALLFNEGLTLAYIGIVLGISWICYRGIELPAQAWLNKRFEGCRVTKGNEGAFAPA